MKEPLATNQENIRLQTLYDYEILDTEFELEFDNLVKLASQICEAPISLISLVEKDRQWFKANTGLDATETSRSVSFCAHAIHQDEIFIVEDASKDERFTNNPLVLGEPHIRFYAGMPLKAPNNQNIGTLCIIDERPRQLTDNQKFALETLSNQVMKLLEHRIKIRETEVQKKQIVQLDEQKNKVLSVILNDISTPLNILESTLSFFSQDELGDEEFKYMFSDTGKAIQRTNYLLANVAHWTKIQLHEEKMEKEEVFLNQLIEDENRVFVKIAQDKGIQLENHIEPSAKVLTSKNTLKLILRSLLLNAYTRQSTGVIDVKSVQDGGDCIIDMIDTGTLLDQAQTDKLLHFQEGFEEIANHSGISLVLTQELAQQIRGKISAYPLDDQGMVFSLKIKISLF